MPRDYVYVILIGVLWGYLRACHYFVLFVIGKPGTHEVEVVTAADDLNLTHRLKIDHSRLAG